MSGRAASAPPVSSVPPPACACGWRLPNTIALSAREAEISLACPCCGARHTFAITRRERPCERAQTPH